MPRYTEDDLRAAAEAAGIDEVSKGRFGPCPKCHEYVLSIREREAGDPFLYCGRQVKKHTPTGMAIVHCPWGEGVDALRRRRARA